MIGRTTIRFESPDTVMLPRGARGYGSGRTYFRTPRHSMSLATDSTCDSHGRLCTADVGRVVARIDGALESAVLVGLDRLSVCRCDDPASAGRAPQAPWAYDQLEDITIGQYGSLPVILLRLPNRLKPLPILLLERGQVGRAIDGLVTLRRLIKAAQPAQPAQPVLAQGIS